MEIRKSQATGDIIITAPLTNTDGSPAIGETTNLFTRVIAPDKTALTPGVDYDEATITEPHSDGNYAMEFPSVAVNKAFTSVDQLNPYYITLDSSTAGVEPSPPIPVRIVSVFPEDISSAVAAIPTNPVNVISAVSGSILIDNVTCGGTIVVYRNSEITIPIDLEKDMTGRDIFLAVTQSYDDAEFTIPAGTTTPRDITADITLSTGAGTITFSADDLKIDPTTYLMEILSRPSGGGDDTPEQFFNLKVKDRPADTSDTA